ncbi:hypothetical protein BGW36DRAFT_426113 [Talaromyces proteolyticus]|uniref:Uncharacterized protein n=1 Tax=Talaromyces proteolyticus TaxID=1131652 RepID=A0AAD4KQT6_9EURO|nr:uncharacterized protein BGW36DRAFT_426113 [Talaromyces proteolyticus]KAH8698405.1 hypothetical protein BGW36DRAFT_426113 [Talaromyces proteolyticus]
MNNPRRNNRPDYNSTCAEALEQWLSTEHLWDKAINSPNEIAQDEKHAIMDWPPLEEMEENSRKYLGKSLQDLIHLASTDPVSLTYPECRFIHDDFHILGELESVKYSNDQAGRIIDEGERWKKWQKAREAVSSADEFKAVTNVQGTDLYRDKLKEWTEPRIKAEQRSRTHPPDWVQKIIDSDDKAWGYVIYRPFIQGEQSDETKQAWDACWERFNELQSGQPVPVFTIGAEEITGTKVFDFVDYSAEMAEVNCLRGDFRDRREKGNLKPGVLSNVFLVMSNECRDSYTTGEKFGWLWAIDPEWTLPNADEDGYDGRVAITWGQLFNKFYDFMSAQRFTLKEIWQDFHEVNRDLSEGPLAGWLFSRLPKKNWPDI